MVGDFVVGMVAGRRDADRLAPVIESHRRRMFQRVTDGEHGLAHRAGLALERRDRALRLFMFTDSPANDGVAFIV